MALISCESVSLAYEGNTIVKDLTFTVNSGDYLCIVGENGSGKSTLMKALLGLKSPSEGKIFFGEGLHKKNIGYLPQQTAVQRDFPASVKEIVLSGCLANGKFKPFYSKKDKQTAIDNMKKLGIENLSDKCYRELSGGQQQRVLLARALCAAEKLIILDEPATGLDPVAAAEMYDIVRTLNQNDNLTVIMVSHDIEHAVNEASHILHIGNTPLFFGKKQEYLFSDAYNQLSGKGDTQ
ncbi:MAG: ABC transporter ATP-binding protein [Clostridia bacterium]|nr:ABC transporter ATP-binding protein [Clostridia bacterium]